METYKNFFGKTFDDVEILYRKQDNNDFLGIIISAYIDGVGAVDIEVGFKTNEKLDEAFEKMKKEPVLKEIMDMIKSFKSK